MAEPNPGSGRFRRGAVLVAGRRRHPGGGAGGPAFHQPVRGAERSGYRHGQGPGGAGGGSQAAAPSQRTVTVLASVTPYQQATLYAKVSGYLSKVLVDKGDHVKAGQLLATIESQETDAQYNSARADLINKQQIAQPLRPAPRARTPSPRSRPTRPMPMPAWPRRRSSSMPR